MPELNIDRLNTIQTKQRSKDRAIDYDTYFGEMEISNSQKQERINAAEDFEKDTHKFILLVGLLFVYGIDSYTDALNQFTESYSTDVQKYIDDVEFAGWYARMYGTDLLETTIKNVADPWYTSLDRAMFNAENEANTVLNRKDYLQAILSGKRYKTWITQRDKRVRPTHREVDGLRIPITDLFSVGNSLMRFPHDFEMGEPEELVSCRCSVLYS